ncbi:MAG: ABC transporter permease [Anaerolineales bacterium]|nr:ABC transporter permease [Chloroflexota bacterium]MBL6983317.1 ABC transporter permease [Anaerolineales bacterium]
MSRYLIQQTLLSIVKLFIFISFMFFFIQIMMPGDFIDQYSLFCNADCRVRLRAQLGLDLPIWQRYLNWIKQIVTLDLGNSLHGEPIMETLKLVVPATLLVFVTGTIIAFLLGLWLGKRTAWQGSAFLSRAATLGGLTLYTSFPPWLTWLFTYLFTKGAGFVVMGEVGGLGQLAFIGLDRLLWADIEVHPSVIAFRMIAILIGFALCFYLVKNLIDEFTKRSTPGIIYLILIFASTVGIWYLLDMELLAFDIMQIAWIPLVTYILLTFGETMMIMQASMDDVMKSEYIITAKAKGLPDSVVLERHAARNALLPVISRLVISLPYLITGVVIIESSTDWPGMGTKMWNALYWQDIPLVMATLLIVGVLSLVARLMLDIITAYLDPRIRYGEKRMPSN